MSIVDKLQLIADIKLSIKNAIIEKGVEVGNKFSDYPAAISAISGGGEGGSIVLKIVVDANGKGYVDLGLPSGTLWADCNVGANNSEDTGLYFQWGSIVGHDENTDYEFYRDNYPEKTISSDLTLEQDAARKYYGGDWKMPTREQIEELCANCTKTKTTKNGKVGFLITGKNGNSIFIPAGGYFDEDVIEEKGAYAELWSRSINNSNAVSLTISKSFFYSSSDYRYYGFNVRGVL